jgi:signal transduction histidine kinase
MGEVGQSAMEIAHRLGNELIPVDINVSTIRAMLKAQGIDHSHVNDELDRVERAVKSLVNMARGLRHKITDLAEVERERTVVPVDALIQETEPSLHAPDNVTITREIQKDLPEVSVVPGQIIDVLRNLFTNAVEAMQDGGRITLRVLYDPNLVGNSPQVVLVQVEDNGPGIDLKDREKVFNLFFSTKKSSGFGLWSSRQYARANGGDLTFVTKVGEGTTFTLSLPVALKQESIL